MKVIYTIGHSSHTTELFLELLKKHKIDSVVDIRSVPFSKYVPQYNKDIIRRILNVNKIHCIYMGKELGIIQEDKSLYNSEGYLDFEKVRTDRNFQTGLSRIENGVEKGYTVSLMCTEKDPLDCHRSILIGRELHKKGYTVLHILPDGNTENQEDLENRLVNLYFSNDGQQTIFQNLNYEEHRKETLDLAYVKRNKDLCKLKK